MKASGLEPEPCSLKGRHSANRVLLPLIKKNLTGLYHLEKLGSVTVGPIANILPKVMLSLPGLDCS